MNSAPALRATWCFHSYATGELNSTCLALEKLVLHFLFPTGSRAEAPDEMFADQMAALTAFGFTTSLCSDTVLLGRKPLQGVPPESTVVYRGWMLTADEYVALIEAIERCGARPYTTLQQYLAAHHLPNWYLRLAELTPETLVLPEDADIEVELRKLDWGAYFLKDFVKSLKTARGSIVHNPADAPAVIAELREYRGRIEGGISVRRVEDFLPDTERRFFVLRGVGYGSVEAEQIPEVVRLCAARIPSPFFSVDVVRRRDGLIRVVEVGDGQVSDLVGWSAAAFAQMWRLEAGVKTDVYPE